MSFKEHAKRELELAGLFSADSDYGGMIGNAVMKLVDAHASEGHSGMSSAMVVDIFQRLAAYKNLTPITDSQSDWFKCEENLWQCVRAPMCFSTDCGKTYYNIDEEGRPIHVSSGGK